MVFENMPFVLVCDARGYPPPWIAWIWKGQVLQNKTNGPKYLLRLRATTEEAGNYTCMAGNSAGVTSYNYQVTVRGTYFNRASKMSKILALLFLPLCLCLLRVTFSF